MAARSTDRRCLQTADGVEIDAVHLPAADGDRSVAAVLAHGFTGTWRSPAIGAVARVLSRTVGVLGFDFRGHGHSGGDSTVGDREVLDLDAAVGWARELGYAHVATIGFSMGGSVVVRHAALHGGVDAVVTVSGPGRWFYRGTRAMRRLHWLVETRPGRVAARRLLRTRVASFGWDPMPEPPTDCAAVLAPIPLLVVHGDNDAYFPLEHAHTLADAAPGHAELWVEPGLGHGENAVDRELVERMVGWVRSSVNGRSASQ